MADAFAPTPDKPKVVGYKEIDFTAKARLYPPETLFLRIEGATLATPNGEEYEVCAHINACILLIRQVKPESGPWVTIGPEAATNAYRALLAACNEAPKEADR